MKRHKKTSGTHQPKGREIHIVPSWFMRPYLVLIEVWEGDIEHAAIVAPVEVLRDKQQLMAAVERLLGGKAVSLTNIPINNKKG